MNFEVIDFNKNPLEAKNDSNNINKDLIIESMILFINKSIWEILDKDLTKIKTLLCLVDEGLKFEDFIKRFEKNSFNDVQKKSIIEFLAQTWRFWLILKFCDYYKFNYKIIDNSHFLLWFQLLLKSRSLENYYDDFLEDIILTETCINTWVIIRWLEYSDESDIFEEYKKSKVINFLDENLKPFKKKEIIEKKLITSNWDFKKSNDKISATLLNSNLENNALVTFFIDSNNRFHSIIYQEKELFNKSICSQNIEIYSDKYAYLKKLNELWEDYWSFLDDTPYWISTFKTAWVWKRTPDFKILKASNDDFYKQKIAA